MNMIYILRGEYEINGLNIYFDIEFFTNYNSAKKYQREIAKLPPTLHGVKYYIIKKEILK